jgi:hypothetical protein
MMGLLASGKLDGLLSLLARDAGKPSLKSTRRQGMPYAAVAREAARRRF